MEGFLVTLAKVADTSTNIKGFSLRIEFPEECIKKDIPRGKCIGYG